MKGIYIHIPFCKKVCYYCDFHFVVSMRQKEAVVNAITKELELRKNYFSDSNKEEIGTIYFGGGTPSVLTDKEIGLIKDQISKLFPISKDAEITLEANPDDLNDDYLRSLRSMGINRLSIGIQSFFDEDLLWMNRRHNGKEAERAVKASQDAGFHNMNIDLIYGLPQLDINRWAKNLEKFFDLHIPHLSAYHLTIEPKTVFGHFKQKGTLIEIDEEQSVMQYRLLVQSLKTKGYVHYEISNFCKEGFYSKHNTNYWNYGQYLGVGPAAHSYNGQTRQWNHKITAYLRAIDEGTPFYEMEDMSVNERYNDYLLTGLRTMWGIERNKIRQDFGNKYEMLLDKELKKYESTGFLDEEEGRIRLTDEGMFVSDKIISGFFSV